MTQSAPPRAPRFVVGRDIGPAGRFVRILAGLLFLAAAASTIASMGALSAAGVGQVAVAFLATGAVYTLLVWVLGPRLFARTDPWLVAALLVAPLALLSVLPFVAPIEAGAVLYVAVSLLAQAAIGYGGCELAGVPALVLRRRYTVYCALNGADVVELWLRGRPRWIGWTLAVAAFVLVMFLGGVAELIGNVAGFFGAYLVFLAVGFVVSRLALRAGRPHGSVGGREGGRA